MEFCLTYMASIFLKCSIYRVKRQGIVNFMTAPPLTMKVLFLGVKSINLIYVSKKDASLLRTWFTQTKYGE